MKKLRKIICVNFYFIILDRWFPSHERASAVGISMAGFHLGNVMSLLATPLVISRLGIFGPFVLFSTLGFLWLSFWAIRIANDPQDCHLISQAELRLIQAGKQNFTSHNNGELPPLGKLLSKLPTWAIIFANVTNNWVSDYQTTHHLLSSSSSSRLLLFHHHPHDPSLLLLVN